ncbi:hypothetical protein BGW42_006858 [Actinomortierella wolfii]|nr:hypothetical protein BGW42_006858 [Actinomortierella wolfii]
MARLVLKRGEAQTAVQATNLLYMKPTEPVSIPTVRRGLREVGMKASRKVKRPALKQQHKQLEDASLKCWRK